METRMVITRRIKPHYYNSQAIFRLMTMIDILNLMSLCMVRKCHKKLQKASFSHFFIEFFLLITTHNAMTALLEKLAIFPHSLHENLIVLNKEVFSTAST